MGDKCEYIGPYVRATFDWNGDKEYVDLQEFSKTLSTLSCFAYETVPIFVPIFELGGHTQIERVKLENATEVVDMSGRDPAKELAAFKKIHKKDIMAIDKVYEADIGWGVVVQYG